MIMMQRPEHLSLEDLREEVANEIYQFRIHHPTDNACSFELFRRALVLRDEHAWSTLYSLYSNLVSSWILHGASAAELTEEDVASLINAVFAKVARSVSAQKFANFPTLEMLLSYIKRCTQTVVIDELRRRQVLAGRECAYESPLETIEQEPMAEDPAEVLASQLTSQDVWSAVACAVPSHAERLILVYVCMLGWKSRELQHLYPALYPTIDDVYRIKRNMIERLRRNRQLQALVAGRVSS